jgi:hypothetical protein
MTTTEEVPEELVDAFQVEELEERVEFGDWSGSASASGGCSTGGGCEIEAEAEVEYEF